MSPIAHSRSASLRLLLHLGLLLTFSEALAGKGKVDSSKRGRGRGELSKGKGETGSSPNVKRTPSNYVYGMSSADPIVTYPQPFNSNANRNPTTATTAGATIDQTIPVSAVSLPQDMTSDIILEEWIIAKPSTAAHTPSSNSYNASPLIDSNPADDHSPATNDNYNERVVLDHDLALNPPVTNEVNVVLSKSPSNERDEETEGGTTIPDVDLFLVDDEGIGLQTVALPNDFLVNFFLSGGSGQLIQNTEDENFITLEGILRRRQSIVALKDILAIHLNEVLVNNVPHLGFITLDEIIATVEDKIYKDASKETLVASLEGFGTFLGMEDSASNFSSETLLGAFNGSENQELLLASLRQSGDPLLDRVDGISAEPASGTMETEVPLSSFHPLDAESTPPTRHVDAQSTPNFLPSEPAVVSLPPSPEEVSSPPSPIQNEDKSFSSTSPNEFGSFSLVGDAIIEAKGSAGMASGIAVAGAVVFAGVALLLRAHRMSSNYKGDGLSGSSTFGFDESSSSSSPKECDEKSIALGSIESLTKICTVLAKDVTYPEDESKNNMYAVHEADGESDTYSTEKEEHCAFDMESIFRRIPSSDEITGGELNDASAILLENGRTSNKKKRAKGAVVSGERNKSNNVVIDPFEITVPEFDGRNDIENGLSSIAQKREVSISSDVEYSFDDTKARDLPSSTEKSDEGGQNTGMALGSKLMSFNRTVLGQTAALLARVPSFEEVIRTRVPSFEEVIGTRVPSFEEVIGTRFRNAGVEPASGLNDRPPRFWP